MIKNIGISGTLEEIEIISKILELEGYKQMYTGGFRDSYLVTYTKDNKGYNTFGRVYTTFGELQNKKEFKAVEFDQAYKYLFDKELFSTKYFKSKKLAINCKSKEECQLITELFKLIWCSEDKLWEDYNESVCININLNSYGSTQFYTSKDYTIIPASFVLKFKNIKTEGMNKKIIGYKLKDNLYIDEYTKKRFLKGVASIGHIHSEMEAPSVEGINEDMILPDVQRHFTAAGVFDLWFTPVYEQEEVVLSIGTPKQKIIINSEGIKCDGKIMSFSDFLKIFERIKDAHSSLIWEFDISEVKIGCSKFSIEEVEKVHQVSRQFYKL